MPAKGTPKYQPLFSPLRIEYSWEGCFEYDRLCAGHSWCLSAADPWRRVGLEVKKGDAVVVPKKDGKLALLKSARAYTDDLQARIVAKASKVSGRPVDSRDWQLLRWLRDKDEDNSVGRGLSLVLNALVRLSTTKSFELLASFVREHVTVEVRQLENHVPAWFYLRERAFEDLDEYLVSFPELFLDGDVLKPDVDDILHQLLHVRCQHKYEVLRVEHTDGVIRVTLRDRATIVQYPKGAICGCIPVPGARPRKEARQEPEGINAPEVVVTSAVVGNALEQLSRVWQDPYAKSVLISSPPGSGKEVFASSIPIGNGRPPEKIFAMSMASEDQRGLERRLYGAMRSDGKLDDGLIARAANGALFLDEVHQPEAVGGNEPTSAARASLLRTLEAGMYFPLESSSPEEVKNVLWVMATSKGLKDLQNIKPIDFWTRMTHAYAIPHPLDFPEQALMPNVVADFFRTFWWDLCDKHYEMDPSGKRDARSISRTPAYWQQRAMLSVLVDEKGTALIDGPASVFAVRFLANLESKNRLPKDFSVRGIRNMVTRLFAIAWSNVAQGRSPWKPAEDFTKHCDLIFEEIYSVACLNPN